MRKLRNILITGGAGFIGSNFIRYLFRQCPPSFDIFNDCQFDGNIINVDSLTYAGNLDNLLEVEKKWGGSRYFFEKCDISDTDKIRQIFEKYNIDTVVNFAAESHVDRSILKPSVFMETNVIGTFSLLNVAHEYWLEKNNLKSEEVLFHQISTDEVYGSLGDKGEFFENSPYNPRSPYSASKASADHIVMSYFHTYNLPVTISNCSNNYGPYQLSEKFIPLMVKNIIENKQLPVYGTGRNIRDWLFVLDHCKGIWLILNKGQIGQKYNIGGDEQQENIRLLYKIINIASKELNKDYSTLKNSITFVKDRLGHDFRYSVNCSKIKKELGWKKIVSLEDGLYLTVKWYIDNYNWIKKLEEGRL